MAHCHYGSLSLSLWLTVTRWAGCVPLRLRLTAANCGSLTARHGAELNDAALEHAKELQLSAQVLEIDLKENQDEVLQMTRVRGS